MSNNELEPRAYQVTKILDLSPQGIIKLSLKQDDVDVKRDNLKLGVCNYYEDTGDIQVVPPIHDSGNEGKASRLIWYVINKNGELMEADKDYVPQLFIAKPLYLKVVFSDEGVDPEWSVKLVPEEEYADEYLNKYTSEYTSEYTHKYTDDERKYYERLIKVTELSDGIVSIKASKAKSLLGKRFVITVSDINGAYSSSTPSMEVVW